MIDTAPPAAVQVLDRAAAEVRHIAHLQVVRWEQFTLREPLPFHAMWYTVPPSASTYTDHHPEAELSLVVTGTATVETADGVVEVLAGAAFLLPGDHPHTVHNRSASEPLVVFSAYWTPLGTEAAR